MRTTLTLDDDVAAALERLRKEREASLKQVVNDVLRQGLANASLGPRERVHHVTRAVDLGRSRIGPLDNVAEVLAVGEGERFR